MRLKHRFWADYTARDFAALDPRRLIAILPVGAIEQHGPHLPLSVDQAILDGIISATLPLISPECPAIFLPTLPVGKSNEHSAWPGTLTFSIQTLISMWMEIGDCVAAAGVRKLVLLNSHGGQISVMDIVARDLRMKHKMITVAANWFAMGLPEGLLTHEEGKTLSESRGELQRSINVAEFCAGETRRLNGETIQSKLPANFAYTLKQPHGVVACITPWNFPVAIPVWKIAPALAAGNTVVFKPATNTPATAVRIVELLEEAGR